MLPRIKAALERRHAWWRSRSRFTRHLMKNLVLGIGITLLLRAPFVQNDRLVVGARNSLLTWQLNTLTGYESGEDLAWIDIDEDAYKAWNALDHKARYMTNRGQLLRLIKYAIAGNPRVLLIDIDLAEKNYDDPNSDTALVSFFKGYTCTVPCTKIVLARTFSSLTNGVAASQHVRAANGSILDPQPTASAAASIPARLPFWRVADPVLWGSVDFDLESDLSVRRWRLWEDSCGGRASGERFPSAVLVAASLERDLSPRAVDDELAGLDRPPCSTAASEHKHAYDDLPFTAAVTDEPLRRRIVYRIPLPGADASRPAGPIIVKAGAITKDPRAMPPSPAFFKDRIVVIGSSFEEGGDADHPTPIGPMPGSFVLINELNALLRHEDLKEATLPVVLLVEIVLIVMMSLLFASYEPAIARSLALVVVALASLTVGLFAFASGFWFDSVLPLIAVLIHEQIARVEDPVARASRPFWAGITSRFTQRRGDS
jgi:CHASE2 domain-containing sensor protein